MSYLPQPSIPHTLLVLSSSPLKPTSHLPPPQPQSQNSRFLHIIPIPSPPVLPSKALYSTIHTATHKASTYSNFSPCSEYIHRGMYIRNNSNEKSCSQGAVTFDMRSSYTHTVSRFRVVASVVEIVGVTICSLDIES